MKGADDGPISSCSVVDKADGVFVLWTTSEKVGTSRCFCKGFCDREKKFCDMTVKRNRMWLCAILESMPNTNVEAVVRVWLSLTPERGSGMKQRRVERRVELCRRD